MSKAIPVSSLKNGKSSLPIAIAMYFLQTVARTKNNIVAISRGYAEIKEATGTDRGKPIYLSLCHLHDVGAVEFLSSDPKTGTKQYRVDDQRLLGVSLAGAIIAESDGGNVQELHKVVEEAAIIADKMCKNCTDQSLNPDLINNNNKEKEIQGDNLPLPPTHEHYYHMLRSRGVDEQASRDIPKNHEQRDRICAVIALHDQAIADGYYFDSPGGWIKGALFYGWDSVPYDLKKTGSTFGVTDNDMMSKSPEPKPELTKEEKVWGATDTELSRTLPRDTYDTWLKTSQFLRHDSKSNTYVIGVGNEYARNWLDTRLRKKIVGTLESVARGAVKIEFVTVQSELQAAEGDHG